MKSNEQTRAQRFVSWTLARCAQDPGFAACLRRADNPDTEHYALGALCVFGVDVENDAERLPFATVGAALCRRKSEQDGGLGLGAALRACCEDAEQGQSPSASSAGLRRCERALPHTASDAVVGERQRG